MDIVSLPSLFNSMAPNSVVIEKCKYLESRGKPLQSFPQGQLEIAFSNAVQRMRYELVKLMLDKGIAVCQDTSISMVLNSPNVLTRTINMLSLLLQNGYTLPYVSIVFKCS